MRLNTDPNLDAPDDTYAALLEAHRDLADEQSALLNARLILLLANHIGNAEVLRQAIAVARSGAAPTALPAHKETAA